MAAKPQTLKEDLREFPTIQEAPGRQSPHPKQATCWLLNLERTYWSVNPKPEKKIAGGTALTPRNKIYNYNVRKTLKPNKSWMAGNAQTQKVDWPNLKNLQRTYCGKL